MCAHFEGHKDKVMLYNTQAREPAVQRLVQIAKDEKIPVVGVSETEPGCRLWVSVVGKFFGVKVRRAYLKTSSNQSNSIWCLRLGLFIWQ
jgi:hypothetical protein